MNNQNEKLIPENLEGIKGQAGTPKDISRLQRDIEKLKQDNESLRQQIEQVKREQVEYLQNVSHQLVAPLNAMKWHIENLTAGRIGLERAKKVLRSIYSQATIAVHLAKNFQLMSNLESDHTLAALREPLQYVNLCQLMVNLADDFQPQGWDKGLRISVVDYPLDKAPQVLVIKPLISQVFSNIIENALKYSKTGSTITIGGTYNSQNDTVSVDTVNEGIPLPDKDIERIFTRGYRSLEARNLYPAGTGFGMYIAKKIVDIHEGTITARADKSSRIVFTVTLHVKKLQGKTRQRDAKDSSSCR